MGLFSLGKASKELQKIKYDNPGIVSDSEIVFLELNSADARKNLGRSIYNEWYEIFSKYQKKKDKIEYKNSTEFMDHFIEIVTEMEEVAPQSTFVGAISQYYSHTQTATLKDFLYDMFYNIDIVSEDKRFESLKNVVSKSKYDNMEKDSKYIYSSTILLYYIKYTPKLIDMDFMEFLKMYIRILLHYLSEEGLSDKEIEDYNNKWAKMVEDFNNYLINNNIDFIKIVDLKNVISDYVIEKYNITSKESDAVRNEIVECCKWAIQNRNAFLSNNIVQL